MATSSAVPEAQRAGASSVAAWADDAGGRAGRLASCPHPDACALADAVTAVAQRARAIAARLAATAAAFVAADERSAADIGVTDAAVRRLDAAARAALETQQRGSGDHVTRIASRPGRRFLRLDAHGDGRIVEVLGDLGRAQHVAVLVPGMANDATNYERSTRTRGVALYDAMRAEDAGPVAVVVWLGYDTPDGSLAGLVEAARSESAERAAPALRRDVEQLRRLNPGAQLTVVAHSYGTVVLGAAMRGGLDADDAVALGSPGMDVDDRRLLGSPGVHLWAAHAGARTLPFAVGPFVPPDPVSFAPVHGEDPAARGFGATRFAARGIGHGSYFDRGSAALRAIAGIAVGVTPR